MTTVIFSAGSSEEYQPEREILSTHSLSSSDVDEPVAERPSCDPDSERLWVRGSSRSHQFTFTGEPGIKFDSNLTPASLTDIFFSEEFIKTLVDATNDYANQTARPLQQHSLFKYWKETNPHERRKFIGMLLYMDIVQLSAIPYYWRLLTTAVEGRLDF
ncbi:hypothetical protein EVAR_64039_1 [Eumeta japonica]|uniref:PiggyBac transposable element-derived protein domain-containing protein n=1 Tax=Eumeta variegata TaxID=151549 RepID=A0A4C1Z787_EUMVA|nr:hypothetical protein EVAR_64039_1 [Eumeta japonica]